MWDKCLPTYYVHFTGDMCTRGTSSVRPFLPVSTRGRNSSRHPPPPNLHIHQNVPRREKNVRDSGYGFQPGPPRTRRRFPRRLPLPVRIVNFQADLPLGSRLPLRRLDPTSVVGHPPRFLRLHARNVAP